MKTWQKVLVGITASIVCLAVVSVILLERLTSGMCEHNLYSETYSPNKELKVVVFERSCGATTGFTTQISILSVTGELKSKSGKVFITQGHPKAVGPVVAWAPDSLLFLRGMSLSSASREEESWGLAQRVSIRYASTRS